MCQSYSGKELCAVSGSRGSPTEGLRQIRGGQREEITGRGPCSPGWVLLLSMFLLGTRSEVEEVGGTGGLTHICEGVQGSGEAIRRWSEFEEGKSVWPPAAVKQ